MSRASACGQSASSSAAQDATVLFYQTDSDNINMMRNLVFTPLVTSVSITLNIFSIVVLLQ